MVRHFTTAALVAALSASLVSADQATCGPGSLCPEDAPCCSLYGQCGVGAYCLGGCDPLFSFDLNSCVPAPACNSDKFDLSIDEVVDISEYLGDASKGNWVSSGQPEQYGDGVLLTMAQDTSGTLLSSSHYVWYGTIEAKFTTSQGKGVVTAFIMMSDVRDEIDFEFVGVDIYDAQTNFYSQGVTNYDNGQNISLPDGSNTVQNEFTYTIDWQPDQLTWAINGDVKRTLNKADTWNDTANRYDYPQTPSRVMLSLWPAGIDSNSQGTIDWAGGLIDWNSPYMQNGYYYAKFSSVSVTCADTPDGANVTGSQAYVYNDYAGTNNTVALVDADTTLASFYATGDDPSKNPNASASASASASGTSTASSSASTSAEVNTIPGVSGGGNQGSDGSGNSGSGSGSSSDTAASGTASAGTSTETQSGWSQGSGGQTGSAPVVDVKERVGGSVFAVIVAVLGLMVL